MRYAIRHAIAKLVPADDPPFALRLVVGVLCAGGALLLRWLVDPWVGNLVPWITFFPVGLVASLVAGTDAAIASLVVGLMLGRLMFVEPRWSLQWPDAEGVVSIVAFVLVGTFLGMLGVVLRQTIQTLRRTAREDMEKSAALREQVADLTRLHEFATRVASARDLDGLLEELLEAVIALQPARQGFIELYDSATNMLRPGVMVGHDPELFPTLANVAVGEGNGACGTAAARRRRVIVDDVETDPLFVDFRPQARAAGFRAVWSTPLLTTGGELVGVLSTHFAVSQRPSERVIRLVELYGRLAADAIEAAALYERAQRARREVETALAAVSEADRRKDEFLAMLAHELRNPLAPIRNSVEVMRRIGPPDGQLVRLRDVIDRQVTQLTRLVDDLLEVSRITRGKITIAKAPVSLSQVVEDAVETVRPLIDQHEHSLSVLLAPEVIRLDGDRARLVQVIANLLTNAAKFTPRGGHITLETAIEEGATAVVKVRDTGIGIPPALRDTIFDLFVQEETTLARSQGGLGIGLTLVQRLVALHDGTVTVVSEGRGRGAELVVRLPASTPAMVEVAPPASAAHADEGGLRVLLVEDNRDTAESFALLLRLEGHTVRVAHHGVQALRMLDELAPQVAIVDLGLPEMTGFELAERLRAHPCMRDALLVAVTGYGRDSDKERSAAAGFDHHLTKPVEHAAVTAVLGAYRDRLLRAVAAAPRAGSPVTR